MQSYELSIQNGAQGTRQGFNVVELEQSLTGFTVRFTDDLEWETFQNAREILEDPHLDCAGILVDVDGNGQETPDGTILKLLRKVQLGGEKPIGEEPEKEAPWR